MRQHLESQRLWPNVILLICKLCLCLSAGAALAVILAIAVAIGMIIFLIGLIYIRRFEPNLFCTYNFDVTANVIYVSFFKSQVHHISYTLATQRGALRHINNIC